MRYAFLGLLTFVAALLFAPIATNAGPYFPATPAPASSYAPVPAATQFGYDDAYATAPFVPLFNSPTQGDLLLGTYETLAPPVAFPGTGAQNSGNNFLQFAQLVGGANAVYAFAPGSSRALTVLGTFLYPGDGQAAVYDYPSALMASSASSAGSAGFVSSISVSLIPRYTGGSLVAFFTGQGASNHAATVTFSGSGQTWVADGGGGDGAGFGNLLYAAHASSAAIVRNTPITVTATLSSSATVAGPLSNLVVVQIVPGTPPQSLILNPTPAPLATYTFAPATATPGPATPTPAPTATPTPFPSPTSSPTPVPSQTGYQSVILGDTPTIYWPLNDTPGTTYGADLSGNGFENLIGSNVALGQQQIFTGTGESSSTFSGNTAQAYEVQAYNQNGTALFSSAMTMEALINPSACGSSTVGPADIVINGADQSGYSMILGIDSTCDLVGVIRASSNLNGLTVLDTTGAMITGQPYLAAFVFNGSSVTLYKNGVAVATGTISGNVNNSAQYAIGGPFIANSDKGFNGYVSQVALYSHALTATQEMNHYNAAIATATCTGCPSPAPTNAATVGGLRVFVLSTLPDSGTVSNSITAGSVLPGLTSGGVSVPGFGDEPTLDYQSNKLPSNLYQTSTITPNAPHLITETANSKIQFQFQMTPGVTYNLNVPSFTDTATSAVVPAVSFPVVAPTVPPIPTPAPYFPDKDPNWYRGSFGGGGPYGYSAGNGDAITYQGNPLLPTYDENQVYAVATAFQSSQVTPRGYVSFGLAPNQIWADGFGGNAGWFQSDAGILEAIHEGQKVAIVLTEYNTQGAQSYGSGGLFDTPTDYATMCGDVAQHARDKYPANDYRFIIFNEPNNPGYWTPRGNTSSLYNPAYLDQTGVAAALYAKACYAAIKRYSPGVTVLGPALEQGGRNSPTDMRTFLQTMYNSGCRTGTCWDYIAVHDYEFFDPNWYANSTTYVNGTGAGQCQNFTTTTTVYPCPLRSQSYKDIQQVAMNNGDTAPGGGYVHVYDTESDIGSCQSYITECFAPAVVAYYMATKFNLALNDDTLDGTFWTNVYNDSTEDIYIGSRVWTSQFTPKQPMLSTFEAFALAGPTPNPAFTNFPTKLPSYHTYYGVPLPMAQANPPVPGGVTPTEPPCLPNNGCPTPIATASPAPSVTPTPVYTTLPTPTPRPSATAINSYVEPADQFADMFAINTSYCEDGINVGPPVPQPTSDPVSLQYLKLSGFRHVREDGIYYCAQQSTEESMYQYLFANDGITVTSGTVGMTLSQLQNVNAAPPNGYGGAVDALEFGNEWDDGKQPLIPTASLNSVGSLVVNTAFNYAASYAIPNQTYEWMDGSGELMVISQTLGQSSFSIKTPLLFNHQNGATFQRVGQFTSDVDTWLAYWSPQIRLYQPTFPVLGASLAFPRNAANFAGVGDGYLVNYIEDHGYPGANFPEGPTGDSSVGLGTPAAGPCSVAGTQGSFGFNTCNAQVQASGNQLPYTYLEPPAHQIWTTEIAWQVLPIGTAYSPHFPQGIPDDVAVKYDPRQSFLAAEQRSRARIYHFNLMEGQDAPNSDFCSYGYIRVQGNAGTTCSYAASLPNGIFPKPEFYAMESLAHFFTDAGCHYPTCTFAPYSLAPTISSPGLPLNEANFEWSSGKIAVVLWLGAQSYDAITTGTCQATTSCYLTVAPVSETVTIPNMTSATLQGIDASSSDPTPAPGSTTAPDGTVEANVQVCPQPPTVNQFGCIKPATALTVTSPGTSTASVTFNVTDTPQWILPVISGEPAPVPTALATSNPVPAGTPGVYPSAGYTSNP
jgi:hypothetical protein